MQKREVNPWTWQDERSYSQAIEIKDLSGTLYVSGQAAIDENGISSNAGMGIQMSEAIKNLEKVISEAGYECANIVRLDLYTTSQEELLQHFSIYQRWVEKHGIKTTLTLLEVKSLFETLKVELKAIVVK